MNLKYQLEECYRQKIWTNNNYKLLADGEVYHSNLKIIIYLVILNSKINQVISKKINNRLDNNKIILRMIPQKMPPKHKKEI